MSDPNTSTASTIGSTPTMSLPAAGTYTVQAATSLATAVGVNIATVGTMTGAQLTELGIGTIRTTVTTAAEASALETLAAGGIKFDLVLGQTQSVANFMGFADAINNMTLTTAGSGGAMSASVIAVEGPDLTDPAALAAYSYTPVGSTPETSVQGSPGMPAATMTMMAGGDYATVELYQAAVNASGTAIPSVAVLPYSTVGTVSPDNDVGPYTSAYNVNLGSGPVGEPDMAALIAAQQTAHDIDADAGTVPTLTVVTQAGATSGGGMLNLLLDTLAPVVSTTGTGSTAMSATYTAANMTYLSSLAASAAGTSTMGTGATMGTTTSALSLFDANGTLTAAGTALNNLEKILVTPTTFASATGTPTTGGGSSTTTSTTTTSTTASTLTLSVGTYTANTNVATNVAVFAAMGGGDNIVWWDNVDSATGTAGHGTATLGFNQVESSVLVFDPTKSASAIGTFANISSLDVTNFGDGPLLVQISNVAGSVTGTASAVGTFAGVGATVAGGSGGGTTTMTGGSGGGTTTMTGGSGGGTTTMTGGSGGGTTTMTGGTGGVTTSAGASGNVTLTSTASMSSTITAPTTGNVIVQSLGTDTVQAGGGLDIVYASGSSATVLGGAGDLVFVAGTGSYTAGGGTGNDVLYGNSGTAVLTGGGTGSSILVAGTGNATLLGGMGSKAVMFGGTATNVMTGSTGGTDTLVGGTGTNTFNMTTGDVAFGGSNGGDTYNTGTASALIVEGPGAEKVNLGGGNATVFGGTGTDTYAFTKGLGGSASIIGFKAGDSLDLTGGFTAADATTAQSTSNTGSFGTVLKLGDGTTINIFGATVSASQITVT
ncbi:MAG: beta strand repeat-containing protein [Janthinobacterium lividum]